MRVKTSQESTEGKLNKKHRHFVYDPIASITNDLELLETADEIEKIVFEQNTIEIARSARMLFIACTAFSCDWFLSKDRTVCSLIHLLYLGLHQEKYTSEENFETCKTALGILFEELRSGRKFFLNYESQKIESSESDFVRIEDDLMPGEIGGIKPGTDIAVSFYFMWLSSGTPRELEKSIYECIGAVSELGLAK